jgi:hypothetical protein
VNSAWQVASDPSITRSIELGNINALTQALQTYLKLGEVSQIEVLDQSCSLLARATSSNKLLGAGCHESQFQRPSLSWQKASNGPDFLTMSLVKEVSGNKKVLLSAHVALDTPWLSVYPELFSLIHSNRIILFDTSRKGQLWQGAYAATGEPIVSMRIGGWLSGFLPDMTKYSLEASPYPIWVGFFVIGLALIGTFIEQELRIKREQSLKQRYYDWSQQFLVLGKSEDTQSFDPKRSWEQILAGIEKRVDYFVEQKQIQWKLTRERQDQMAFGAVQRDKIISDLQEKLAGLSDLASLKEQLQHSSKSFLTRMEDVRGVCEDMFDIASQGLATHSKSLQALSKRWKEGINDVAHPERGARKFLRSLSETPSERPGLTRLDDDLDSLTEITGITIDQSLHLSILSRQVLTELEAGVRVAGMWLSLSMRENEREKTSDWLDCLLCAQNLVIAEAAYKGVVFERLPQFANTAETYPEVPKVALVSGLFHLYMALLAGVDLKELTLPIVLRQKRFSSQGTMILSLPHLAEDVGDASPGRSQGYHMDLAKAILTPLGIRAAFLPPTIAGVPVAITWPLPGKNTEIGSSKLTSTEGNTFTN